MTYKELRTYQAGRKHAFIPITKLTRKELLEELATAYDRLQKIEALSADLATEASEALD